MSFCDFVPDDDSCFPDTDWEKECGKWKEQVKKDGILCTDDWQNCYYKYPLVEELLPGWAGMYEEGGLVYENGPCSENYQQWNDELETYLETTNLENAAGWLTNLQMQRRAGSLRVKSVLAKRGQFDDLIARMTKGGDEDAYYAEIFSPEMEAYYYGKICVEDWDSVFGGYHWVCPDYEKFGARPMDLVDESGIDDWIDDIKDDLEVIAKDSTLAVKDLT